MLQTSAAGNLPCLLPQFSTVISSSKSRTVKNPDAMQCSQAGVVFLWPA